MYIVLKINLNKKKWINTHKRLVKIYLKNIFLSNFFFGMLNMFVFYVLVQSQVSFGFWLVQRLL